MKTGAMELKSLVGEHMLDAVDFSTESIADYCDEFQDCQAMRFRLDGNVYVAVEDPGDGYRRMMRDLAIDANATMKNTFHPVKVIARHRTQYRYGESADILEIVDAETGGMVIEVGTENTGDWYPYFVAAFHPEAMAINAKPA